jgi:hypothetical protein
MTLWYFSIVTNVMAITISTLISIFYTQWQLKNKKSRKQNLQWYDYIVITFLTMLSGIVSYSIVYLLSGYVPMSQISRGFIFKRR